MFRHTTSVGIDTPFDSNYEANGMTFDMFAVMLGNIRHYSVYTPSFCRGAIMNNNIVTYCMRQLSIGAYDFMKSF